MSSPPIVEFSSDHLHAGRTRPFGGAQIIRTKPPKITRQNGGRPGAQNRIGQCSPLKTWPQKSLQPFGLYTKTQRLRRGDPLLAHFKLVRFGAQGGTTQGHGEEAEEVNVPAFCFSGDGKSHKLSQHEPTGLAKGTCQTDVPCSLDGFRPRSIPLKWLSNAEASGHSVATRE